MQFVVLELLLIAVSLLMAMKLVHGYLPTYFEGSAKEARKLPRYGVCSGKLWYPGRVQVTGA